MFLYEGVRLAHCPCSRALNNLLGLGQGLELFCPTLHGRLAVCGKATQPQPKMLKDFENAGREQGDITKGVFSLHVSLASLKSLNSLENGRILLWFSQSGDSLESL